MLNNLVNSDDLFALGRRVRRRDALAFVRHMLTPGRRRVEKSWSHVGHTPTHWFDVPLVRAHQNSLVTGDLEVDHTEYFARKYLDDRTGLSAISLGCGVGSKEVRWAQTGKFASIDAYDISSSRIEHAMRRSTELGLDDILSFRVEDAYNIAVPDASYDVVIFEDALHHFAKVDEILHRVRNWLAPSGFLFVNEYVGPNRFQWTDRQLELATSYLNLLPDDLRSKWSTGDTKTRIERPSRLRMILKDPSEAADSESILPSLKRRFEIVETRDLGGTIVHLVLQDIAHNFVNGSPLAEEYLRTGFALEELSLRASEIKSDHVLAICRRRE